VESFLLRAVAGNKCRTARLPGHGTAGAPRAGAPARDPRALGPPSPPPRRGLLRPAAACSASPDAPRLRLRGVSRSARIAPAARGATASSLPPDAGAAARAIAARRSPCCAVGIPTLRAPGDITRSMEHRATGARLHRPRRSARRRQWDCPPTPIPLIREFSMTLCVPARLIASRPGQVYRALHGAKGRRARIS
jgi:hypothetical protein